MNKLISMIVLLVMAGAFTARIANAQPAAERDDPLPREDDSFLLGPPKGNGPVVVRANFQLHDINEINEKDETFAFSGVLTLKWQDERQVFDRVATGVDEKVYQGAQFNELYTGWFPQVVLANGAGTYEKHGSVLRIQPDGALTLVETVKAVSNAEIDMRRYPFDTQRLEAVFEVLGFDDSEVVLLSESETTGPVSNTVTISQWSITGIGVSTRDRPAPYAGRRGVASGLVVSVDAQRKSFFISRLVILPLAVIVFLSFSVFWMDRSSLGDRISVSFIGILTGVAYQIVMSEILPQISYVTFVHAFINLSFLTMCATVVINVVVGTLDHKGKAGVGDRIDRCCRWLFPLIYLGLMMLALGATFVLF